MVYISNRNPDYQTAQRSSAAFPERSDTNNPNENLLPKVKVQEKNIKSLQMLCQETVITSIREKKNYVFGVD